jgi:murein DD-endopeptidase MepM/ murein hydrolase activator NlpD
MYSMKVSLKKYFLFFSAIVVLFFPPIVLAATIPYLITPGITAYQISKTGETFYEKDLTIQYVSGKIIFSSNPDGTGDTFVDDAIEMTITKQGGTAQKFIQNYQNNCTSPGAKQPKDLTSYFNGEGFYDIHVKLKDACGFWVFSSALYLVNMNAPEPVISPTPPTPFLDLPWNYDCKQSTPELNAECAEKKKANEDFSVAAMNISYYFDHTFPLLWIGSSNEPASGSGQVTTFDGKYYPDDDRTGRGYSAHDGYDFGKKAKIDYGDPVLAAASGSARYINSCISCGNMVVIDHPNGYQTRYMHLQKKGLIDSTPNKEVSVIARQVIGEVGNTGNCQPKDYPEDIKCAHIHFMVVKGNQKGISENMPDRVTDPYGWEPFTDNDKKDPDPWEHYSFYYNGILHTGTKSYYLWTKNLQGMKSIVPLAGGTYTAGDVSVKIEPDTYTEPVNLEMHYVPSTTASGSAWSIGPVISVIARNMLGDVVTLQTKPVKLIWFPLDQTDLSRFKPGTFYLYSSKDNIHWTQEQEVDPFVPGNITATVNHFTYFAIMGQRKDLMSPVSTAELQGEQGQQNWFRSDVHITLSASDGADTDPAGVNYILYKLDENEWETYTAPLLISQEGHHSVSFYTEDFDGNVEAVKSIEFTIDKTAPIRLIPREMLT